MTDLERDGTGLVGRRLGEFIVREELSSGGFGMVFRAEQPALAREAVIKVLHRRLRASENVIQRFLREARLASRLDHPYAAHIYAFGAEPDGLRWIAMELVRGTPLDRLLDARGPITLERFVPLLERICQVVQTAHEQGIVHRDLKPGNVMVLVRAGQLLPKLLDLGIAKLGDEPDDPARVSREQRASSEPRPGDGPLADTAVPDGGSSTDPDSGGRLTEEGAVMGSPLYMAPEQWLDAGTVDARTDIYALGVLSYQALTGRPPFAGMNRYMLAVAHAQQTPPPLGESFPPALDAVIARALAKRPADRFQSALELAAAFRSASGIVDEPVGLPRLDEGVRILALARAPQPIAHAVSALDTARNAHQARDAIWQLVRVATRLVGILALAAHSHVGTGTSSSRRKATEVGIKEALRRLRRRALPDAEWLALAQELCAPFAAIRAAYPVPELLDFLEDPGSPLAELIALRDGDAGASNQQVREMLDTAMPIVERLVRDLEFLGGYDLVVPTDTGVARWMGSGRGEAMREAPRGQHLELGQPALLDATGAPVVSLWPFVQLHEPAPGVPAHLFFLEGKGRRGARLVALPEAFEHEDEALWEVVGALVGETAETGHISDEEVCPFPGLAAFTAHDATRFYGRERETEAFVNRLRAQPLLAVVGPSGAGKSSFVQAGVLPALPDDWQVVILRPGPAPLVSLTSRLQNYIDPNVLRSELHDNPAGLGTLLRARATRGMTVIVVDQLEELFTLCEDVADRNRFIEALVRAARSADDPVRVVFTLRDDFLLHAEALPALRSRLAPALHLLTTPGRDDLLRILTEPLRQAGYELDDPTLAEDMITALGETRSPLALLSFTGSRLWELRDRRFRQLSRKAYVSLGGVGGALAQHAETTLATMRPEEQRLVREVFRHAVTANGTRAVLARTELDQVLGGGAHATAVVEKLIAARLLVTAESSAGGEQVEITHEALIDAWPRLVTWRREDAEGARMRDQLRSAVRQWEERGRPTGLLWRGDALAEYRLWRPRYPGALTDAENAFAAASLAEAQRSARSRTLALAVAFAVLAGGVVALLFLNARVASQRSRAQDNEQLAEEKAQEARTAAATLRANLLAQYEDQGRRLVIDGDPRLGLAYLMKARQLGARGPAHELLVATAAGALSNKLVQVRHDSSVIRARYSPDGTRLVTCGFDNRARLWDAASGRLIADLPHAASVTRADISGDGRFVVTASDDGSAAMWELAAGHPIRVLRPAGGQLQAVAVSPDSTLVVTLTAEDVVELWDAQTGALRATLQPVRNPQVKPLWGSPLAFSADSARLAVGDKAGVVRIWDLRTLGVVATNRDHGDQITWVRFAPDGARLVVASGDATASVVDARSGRRLLVVHHKDLVNAVELSPDGATIATASNDRTAVLWDAHTGALLHTLEGHAAGVNVVAFRSDGRQVATGADDATAALWDVATGRRDARLVGHGDAVRDASYDRSGARLITASDDGSAIAWSTVPQQPAIRLVGHRGTVFSAELSVDGTTAVTGGEDGTIRFWDRATGVERRAAHQDGPVRRVQLSPDGRLVASVGRDRLVHLWDVATGREARVLRGHAQPIVDVAWSPDGTQLATASQDGTARVWAMRGDAPPLVYRGHGDRPLSSIAYAPAGDAIITTADDNTARMWSAVDGTERAKWSTGSLGDASLDPTGTWVAGSTNQASARVWSAATGDTSVELLGHAGSLLSTRWSPDGEFLVTASIDGTARIWDARRGEQLAVLAGPAALIWSASYAPDQRSIITAGSDGVATIWTLPAPAPDLARLVRCEVPYELRGDRMVHVAAPADCTSSTGVHSKDTSSRP